MGFWRRLFGREDLVIEFMGGPTIRVPRGTSQTVGSGPGSDCRIEAASVAPLHLRIDNRVVPPSYDPSHPYCARAWVADVRRGSAASGFSTGVARDPGSSFVMPLDPGEVAPLSDGTIIVLGKMQLRIVSGS